MFTLKWPALLARLKPKIPAFDASELNQEEIRELQRIRDEIRLQLENERLKALLWRRF